MRLISLTLSLFVFWLLLSGLYKPWFVISGAISSIAVVALLAFGKIADEEAHPIGNILKAGPYWLWLLKEIVVSALSVTKIILHPSLPINPKLVWVKASQKTSVGLVTYANSITLTPGTISVRVSSHDREILVHALNEGGAHDLYEGEMDRRVCYFEGKVSK